MRIGSIAGAAALALGLGWTGAAAAQTAKTFYAGKTLTIIVPSTPGGGYDSWARLLAPYLMKSLGLAQTRIQNMPGAGGLIGTNQIYSAKPDGLTIGDTNAAGDLFAEMAKDSGVNFKIAKFEWIGRPDNDPKIIAVHADGPYKSFDSFFALKGEHKSLKCLASGKGSADYNATVIIMNAFHLPFHMVAAFKGSHAEKATFLSGDGDTISVSASDIAELGSKNARVVLLNTTKPFARLANVPTVVQVAKQRRLSAAEIAPLKAMAGILSMGHAFATPPGVPAARLKALRAAFKAALSDPAFIAKAKKSGLYLGYESGADLKAAVQAGLSQKSQLAPLLKTS